MQTTAVIIRPMFSEKSVAEASKGKFTFLVHVEADKKMIRKTVEERFKVKVVALTTATMKGRKKRVGKRRVEVKDSILKKAIVTVAKGQKIDIFTA